MWVRKMTQDLQKEHVFYAARAASRALGHHHRLARAFVPGSTECRSHRLDVVPLSEHEVRTTAKEVLC